MLRSLWNMPCDTVVYPFVPGACKNVHTTVAIRRKLVGSEVISQFFPVDSAVTELGARRSVNSCYG